MIEIVILIRIRAHSCDTDVLARILNPWLVSNLGCLDQFPLILLGWEVGVTKVE